MGHSVNYVTCRLGEEKETEMDCNEKAVRDGDYHKSLGAGIRWLNIMCDSEEAAYSVIEKNDRGWYDQLAVKFRSPKRGVSSKKMDDLTERRKKAYARLRGFDAVHYKDAKSERITCRKCGSAIATKYIRSNNCPVCWADMRPESTLKAKAAAEENLKKIDEAIEAEKKRLAADPNQSEVLWLVKYEYHV